MIPADGTSWLPGPILRMRPSGIGSRYCPGRRFAGDIDTRSAIGARAVEAMNDRENLKGGLREKRLQTLVRRHPNGTPIGQDNKVVMLERGWQAGVAGFVVIDESLPEALGLCRRCKFGKTWLEHDRLLAGNGEKGGHE